MGTYNIPRNTKGEGRLFYIFSTKALIYTVGGIILGVILRYMLVFLGTLFKARATFNIIGMIIIILLAILGFVIGTFKLPHNDRFEITKKAAGTKLDKFIIESIRFKINKKKLYIYDTDELTREEIEVELEENKKNEAKELEMQQKRLEKLNRDRRGYIK